MPSTSAPVAIGFQPLQEAALVQRPFLAVSMDFSAVQWLTQSIQDDQAPHFRPDQEPLQDGRPYTATSGQIFYRPQLRVAQRTVAPLGPDVRFYPDVSGVIRLQFELEELPATQMPTGAMPLNIRLNDVLLRWQEGGQARQRIFGQPILVANDSLPDNSRPSFYVRVGSVLSADEVQMVVLALKRPEAQARLDITMTYSYWVDATPEPTPTPRLPIRDDIEILRPFPMRDRIIQPLTTHASLGMALRTIDASVEAQAEAASAAALVPQGAVDTLILDPGQLRELRTARKVSTNFEPRIADFLRRKDILDVVRTQENERRARPDHRDATLARTLPFTFEPALDMHRAIYGAIESQASLDESWTTTDFGEIRRASFPNTIYRLPDELRLAFNSDLGTPHVIPTIYRTASDEPRVRVTLRVVPWHNPERLVKLRDYLYRATGGGLASPTVTVGGYQRATLRLTSAFPEDIRTIVGDAVDIDLERGTDMTLDLSLEFYSFLTNLLAGPVGLTGVAEVIQGTETLPDSAPQPRIRTVPMRLSLGAIAQLPFDVSVDPQALSPTQVRLVNRAGAAVRVGNCVPRLLQYDTNSVVPIEVFESQAITAFPATLTPGETLAVDIKPADGATGLLWNAVQLEVLGQELSQTPREVLDRIHEIAPGRTLSWQITAECPPFLQTPVAAKFENLFRVEVEIIKEGFAPKQLVMRREKPTAVVTMERTLRDILGPNAGAIETFSYRVRNIYFDHEGVWSEPRPASGVSIAVFPNPIEQRDAE